MGNGESILNVTDFIPIIGGVVRTVQSGVLLVQGDTDAAGKAIQEAGMNFGGDALGLVTGGAGKVAFNAGRAVTKTASKLITKAVPKAATEAGKKAAAEVAIQAETKTVAETSAVVANGATSEAVQAGVEREVVKLSKLEAAEAAEAAERATLELERKAAEAAQRATLELERKAALREAAVQAANLERRAAAKESRKLAKDIVANRGAALEKSIAKKSHRQRLHSKVVPKPSTILIGAGMNLAADQVLGADPELPLPPPPTPPDTNMFDPSTVKPIDTSGKADRQEPTFTAGIDPNLIYASPEQPTLVQIDQTRTRTEDNNLLLIAGILVSGAVLVSEL